MDTASTSTRSLQSYEDTSEGHLGPARLAALRQHLALLGLDGFLLPRTDEHQSEYLPGYAERVAWLTGFTGSNAFVVVLPGEARVFTDGRYSLQIRAQLDQGSFTPDDMVETPISGFIADQPVSGLKIGFDPSLHTVSGFKKFKQASEKAGFSLVATDSNPIDAIWTDQPARPMEPILAHPIKYAGQPVDEKIASIAENVCSASCEAVILPQADGNAWIFNLRGSDVPQKPMFLSFAIVHATGEATLFIDPGKITPEAKDQLGERVSIEPISSFLNKVKELAAPGAKIMVDPANVSIQVAQTIENAGGVVVEAPDPMEPLRAVKNPSEQEGARAAHRRDGAAVSRFLAWFDRNAPQGELDEISVAEKLLHFRQETGALRDIAFPTISGSGANGAIVHYRVTVASNAPIAPNSLYLTDSGAQYLDGTTDITRTLLVGDPTPEFIRCYTLVLKGHIALATARFPKGTTGANLDALARQFLWSSGMDYAHGTGHGVGSYLGVHEGRARIAKQGHLPLEPGMLLSNEPGYYREGAFGLRLENLVFVTEPQDLGGDAPMMGFETITRAPFERRLIDTKMLTSLEREWVDAYHQTVRDTLISELEDEDAAFLEKACAPL
ncbi:MAG: aminopeptidase P family protein [Pseudomonadota bacterium]